MAATKAWPLPYNFDFMVPDARFLGTLNHYSAIAFDASGNLFGLYGNHLIKVTPDGVQSHIAGADAPGFADGAGAAARFNQPTGLAIDKSGTIYIADFHNARIRTVSRDGLVSTHTAATAALAAGVDGSGASRLDARHIALDGAGNLYLGGGARVHKVTPAGAASTIDMASNYSIVADKAGNVYSTDDCRILKASGLGVVSTLAVNLRDAGQPSSGKGVVSCRQFLAIDNDDNLYLGNYHSSTVRKFTAAGVLTTIGGKAGQDNVADRDGIGAEARIGYAREMGVDGQGNIYVQQSSGMRKVSRAGVVTTVTLAGTDGNGAGMKYFTGALAFKGSLIGVANHVLYRIDEQGTRVPLAGKPGGGPIADGEAKQATFATIESVARDGQGNLYVIDSYSLYSAGSDAWEGTRIRRITPAGLVSTVLAVPKAVGPEETLHRLAADKDGNLFVTTHGAPMLRLAVNGSQSRIVTASGSRQEITVDQAGNAYVAGYVEATRNFAIEKISPSGKVSIFAGKAGSIGVITDPAPASLGHVGPLTVDDDGVVYIISENSVLRIVQ